LQQHQGQTLSQRFQQYRPSKTALFWSCAGCVALAMIVGFSWGGWTTGGTAQEMADKAAADARQELAAVVWVDRFMAAPDVGIQLPALKKITSSYSQSKFVEDGGWAIIVPASSATDRKVSAKTSADDRKAAGLCAEELAKREIPATGKAALIDDDARRAIDAMLWRASRQYSPWGQICERLGDAPREQAFTLRSGRPLGKLEGSRSSCSKCRFKSRAGPHTKCRAFKAPNDETAS
jgi:hypothetical protein